LDASSNKFTGIADVTVLPLNITSLRLASNRIDGVSLLGLNALESVDISDNPTLAAFPLPPTTNSSKLHTFAATGCNLSGPIPSGFAALSSPALRTLSLSNNSIALPLPDLSQLERLYLNSNPLRASLAEVLAPNMWRATSSNRDFDGPRVSLRVLDLTDCALVGGFPPYMWTGVGGNLFLSLEDLSLADNPQLSGSLPRLWKR
jgi:Leucine-rich repeat (LRR) protein